MTKKKRILIYSPHAGIAFSTAIEAKLASHLQSSGYEVFYTSCHRVLRPFCTTMSAHSLNQDSPDFEKDRVCRKCEKSANYVVQRYKLNDVQMQDFLTAEDLAEVKKFITNATRENFLDLEYLGVPVGRKALYELFLQHKKSDYDLSDKEWNHFKMALENSLKSLISGSRIVEKIRPDLIICYNSQYGAHGVIEAYSKNKNIPFYFIHGSLNLSRMLYDLMFATAPVPSYYKRVASAWQRFKDIPLNSLEVTNVLGHIRKLFSASSVFVYSSPTTAARPDIRKIYEIAPNQKVLLATMSSYDERFAAEANLTLKPATDTLFKSQIEWIQFLIDYVKTKPDLFLLIRVHPREFPNKRERVKSQHAESLEKIFNKLPSNARINWPSDNISLYHLAEETSVFLNAWSSTGKEMAALGRPVVLYSKELPFYASELNLTASTTEQYISFIEDSLNKPFDFNRIAQAFRLFNLEFHQSTLDISSMFDIDALYPKIKFLRKVEGKLLKYTSSIRQLKRLCKKPAVLSTNEELDLFLSNPNKDLMDYRTAKNENKEEEIQALTKALQEIFKSLYPYPINPSNPSTSLYLSMKSYLEQPKASLSKEQSL